MESDQSGPSTEVMASPAYGLVNYMLLRGLLVALETKGILTTEEVTVFLAGCLSSLQHFPQGLGEKVSRGTVTDAIKVIEGMQKSRADDLSEDG